MRKRVKAANIDLYYLHHNGIEEISTRRVKFKGTGGPRTSKRGRPAQSPASPSDSSQGFIGEKHTRRSDGIVTPEIGYMQSPPLSVKAPHVRLYLEVAFPDDEIPFS
jgi:hypothetical protein